MNGDHDETVPLVEQIRNETYAWGLGTTGPEACKKALRHAQVEVLILAEELEFPLKIQLIHLAEQAGSRIVVVHRSDSLARLGGAACLLRYREQDPQFRRFEAV
jgi:stalled ribosome rescue protein Dom34